MFSVARIRKPSTSDLWLLKADAGQLPLRQECVSFVVATPPYLGEKCYRRGDFCTANPEHYGAGLSRYLAEAGRIVQPWRFVALISSRPPRSSTRGVRLIRFHILQKRVVRSRWTLQCIRSLRFRTHYVDVKNFLWWALPVKLYRTLLERYTRPGEAVAHVFSGSGNCALAALQSDRRPLLIDLHHHREIRRRLIRRLRARS